MSDRSCRYCWFLTPDNTCFASKSPRLVGPGSGDCSMATRSDGTRERHGFLRSFFPLSCEARLKRSLVYEFPLFDWRIPCCHHVMARLTRGPLPGARDTGWYQGRYITGPLIPNLVSSLLFEPRTKAQLTRTRVLYSPCLFVRELVEPAACSRHGRFPRPTVDRSRQPRRWGLHER